MSKELSNEVKNILSGASLFASYLVNHLEDDNGDYPEFAAMETPLEMMKYMNHFGEKIGNADEKAVASVMQRLVSITLGMQEEALKIASGIMIRHLIDSDAPNFMVHSFVSNNDERYKISVERESGKSVAQVLTELRAENAALKKELGRE